MYRMPAMGMMMMPNGGAVYGAPWGAPGPPPPPPPPHACAPQGPAWGVPFQQGENFHMMAMQPPMQQVVRGNPEMGRGPDGGGNREEMVQRAERAARQAYEELVGEEKHISVAKLSQRTLAALGVSSFELLGFRMQDVPCLRNLALVEGKVGC
jgi:hypothetical protein